MNTLKIGLFPVFLTLSLYPASHLQAQTTLFHPTINSIGVEIQEAGAYDSCYITYKEANAIAWKDGMPADRIEIAGKVQFRGSLFLLNEHTVYDIKISLSGNSGGAYTFPVQQAETLASPEFSPTANVKWVSPNGSGNAYTPTQPGNLTTLLSSGLVGCGTTIMCLDGVYHELGYQLTINTDCTENSPIVFMAAPGAHPVFDGGTPITTAWTQHPSDPKLFYTALPSGTSHSNICVLGDRAIYPYPSLAAEVLLGNYNLSALNFGYDGFVRDENTIWIKTLAGADPDTIPVVVSNAFRFLTIYGNNRNAYLKFKGIEIRHVGKPQLNALGSANDSYGAITFDLRNVHHVYFDSCKFAFNTSNIHFTGECNHIVVQNCHFKHDTGKWSHAMIKKSHVFVHTLFYTVSSSRARDVEDDDIFLNNTENAIIRNNVFDGMNSGVESYIDNGLNQEIDIYNNTFIDNFDAIECDGYWTNLRVWNNEVIRPMAGVSAAPPLIGPRYFYRNVFHHMQGRINEQDDPYFIECYPPFEYKLQGIGIKTNSGAAISPERGNLYFFNNTYYAADTLGFVFTSWDSEWREANFANNIFYQEVKNPGYYASLGDKPEYQWHSENDDFYSGNPNAPVLVAKRVHGQFDCTDIYAASDIESTLSDISGSASIVFSNPLQANPEFVSTTQGGFALQATSPLIDAGVALPGFYDFSGSKPDVGAREFLQSSSGVGDLSAENGLAIYPNPAFQVLNIDVHGATASRDWQLLDARGQILRNGHTYLWPARCHVTGLSPGVYFIRVGTQVKAFVHE